MRKTFKVSVEDPEYYSLQISIDDDNEIFIEIEVAGEITNEIEIRKSEIPRLIKVLQKVMEV